MQSVPRAPSRTSCAFDRLVEPHLTALFAVAHGIVGSPDLAGDAVQEALVCLWAAATPPADARGWLVRAVVHKSLHIARSRARREQRDAHAATMRPESCPLCDPAALAQGSELRMEIESAVAALSDELRAVLQLRGELELDYAEIAARLAVPIGTVRSRLHRARALLARRFADTESAELAGAPRE